jgi:hypothetical protein
MANPATLPGSIRQQYDRIVNRPIARALWFGLRSGMGTKGGKVAVYFADRDGVTWRVYQFGVIAGRLIAYPVGSMQGDYRGFVRTDNPTIKRTHAMFRESADLRGLTAHQLQRQLDASEPVGART